MQRGKKIAAALVLLGLGLGTAMLFRRTETTAAPATPPPPTPQKEALVLRESPAAKQPHPLSSSVIPLKPAKAAKPPRDRDTPLAAPPKVNAPPELPAVFDRSLAASAAEDPRAIAALARLEATSSLSGSNAIPQGPPPLRTHRVVDGDTLAQLAERFLGNADRYEEIYSLNESKLPDPNILPIGVELKIPPRDGSLSAPATPAASLAPAENRGSIDPLPPVGETGGLVPVPAGQPHEQ